jgi:hypothetical protein
MDSLALGARRSSGIRKAAPIKKKKTSGIEAYIHKWLPNPLHRSIAKHTSFFVCSVVGFVWFGEALNPAQAGADM